MKKRWMGLVVCLAIGQVQAASFDCGKVNTKVEKLICADEELSKLDEALAKAYKDSAKRTAEPDRYKREQRSWLKEREACLNDADKAAACLSEQYTRRVQALSGNCWRHKSWQAGMANGSYTASGKNWPMCRIMLENLNRFCHEKPEAMTALRLDPGIISLKTIEWQPVDPRPHLEWIKESIRWRGYRQDATQPDEWEWNMMRPEIERRVQSGQLHMWEAKFDLSNDGVPELVRWADYGGDVKAGERMQSFGGGTGLVITDEHTGLPVISHAFRHEAWALFGYVVINAGKSYLLRGNETYRPGHENDMELAEPSTNPHYVAFGVKAPPEQWTYGDTTVCMFKRITN